MLEKNKADKVWQDASWFIAFGFGSGLMPIAPGTWGTIAAFPVYLLLACFSLPVYLLITALFFAIGVRVSDKVTKELGVQDYSGIVWDEVVGYLIVMAGVPFGIGWMIAGFFLFRLFDIWKPWPVCFVDKKIHGGWGIMLDDALAALFGLLLLHLAAWILVA